VLDQPAHAHRTALRKLWEQTRRPIPIHRTPAAPLPLRLARSRGLDCKAPIRSHMP
jgi:hypothetical protein